MSDQRIKQENKGGPTKQGYQTQSRRREGENCPTPLKWQGKMLVQ